jgi:hypothetical protein
LMMRNNRQMEDGMITDLASLRTRMAEVNESKEQIRKYGFELGHLFKKYEAREHQLNAMIIGMEELVSILKEKNGEHEQLR